MMVGRVVEADKRTIHRVTPAQAHTWAVCGGFFQVQHRSGRPFVATYSSLLGTSVHELAVAFDRADSTAQEDLDQLIDHNWRAGRFAAVDEPRALTEARALLTAYVDLRQTETGQILGSEVFCQTTPRTLGAGQAITLSGRIDRVARRNDGTLELLDLKTGAFLPTYDELYNDPATTIYHLLAAERYRARHIVVVQLSLRTGSRIEVTLDADGVAAGKDLLREMVRQLAADDFALTPSASCAYCPVRTTCPALVSSADAAQYPL